MRLRLLERLPEREIVDDLDSAVRELALPLIFCVFAFSSPVKAMWSALLRIRSGTPPADRSTAEDEPESEAPENRAS